MTIQSTNGQGMDRALWQDTMTGIGTMTAVDEQTAGEAQDGRATAHAPARPGRAAAQLQQIRRSLLITAGGTGQLVGVNLKAKLIAAYGDGYRDKIVLLSFDSTEEPFAATVNDQVVRLEPGTEFFNIGQVPISRIKQNLDRQRALRDRLGAHIDRLPSVMRGNGMKMIRPAALAAYYWHFGLIHQTLSKAIWRLAGRDKVGPEEIDQEQGINIYIIGSLVGGTGSGLFLDLAYHARSLVAKLGTQNEYCTVTGVGVLAQAFPGIGERNLYANGGAALKELTHLMLHENFEARYPNGHVVDLPEAPFNLFYVLDGVDERGRTWNGIQEVAAVAADGLFLQMASQIGRRGDNAFDNVDDILVGRTREGEPTFLSSFGLGYLEFDARGVAALCARWLALELAAGQWLRPATGEAAQAAAAEHGQRVSAAQLSAALRVDPETGGEMYIDLPIPSWLADKRHEAIATEAAQHVRAYGRVRVGEEMSGQCSRNAQRVIAGEQERWDAWLAGVLFAPDFSLPAVAATYKQAQAALAERMTAGQRRLVEIDAEVDSLATALEQAENSLVQAAGSLVIGRAGRVRQALAAYFQAAEALFDRQLQQAEARSMLLVWSSLAQHLTSRARDVRFLSDRLASIVAALGQDAVAGLRRLQSSNGARLSLAEEGYVRQLYARARPGQTRLALPADAAAEPLRVLALDSQALQGLILGQLSQTFAAIGALSIEDVLRDRAGEMSPAARRRQVFQLATPSWSIDHTRLPEGGAGRVRLEVVGVEDENATLFNDELSRVSTHDRQRLIAYVMVAGAAPSALQQYDQYEKALAQARGVLPVHVLPEFMAETNQGQLAFALGSIFQLIQSEGAHFYYQPADELQERVRLGQGLANAVAAMTAQEGLTREVLERVDSRIAHLGLERSIEVLAEYYAAAPEGRTKLDSIARELKRQVRTYTDELRQIREFSGGQQ